MQGNYISLVLHKIQCRSLLIYQLLLSSCHIGIFLLEIYGCTLAMYHCSYLISWQTQAHPHSPRSCTLLQTTNRRNICLHLEDKTGNKHCCKAGGGGGGGVSFSTSFSLDPTKWTRSTPGLPGLTGSPLQLWPLKGCWKNDFCSYANTHQIPRRLDMAWKFSYLSTVAYVCLFTSKLQTPILQASHETQVLALFVTSVETLSHILTMERWLTAGWVPRLKVLSAVSRGLWHSRDIP